MSAPTLSPSLRVRSEFLARFMGTPKAMIGCAIVGTMVLIAIFAPWLAPTDPTKINVLHNWRPPSSTNLLGTDELGRDVLSRLIAAARISMLIAISVLAIIMSIGVTSGVCAGWVRGRIDGLVMRVVDVTFAFPEVIIAILVASILGPGVLTTIVTLSLVWWPGIARLARSLVLSVRNELYIEAAISCATPIWRIMLWHVLPNIFPQLLVRASLSVGMIIMAEAGLSFLGIGVVEPNPTWGGMIREGLPNLRTDPHLALSASAALMITMIGFNLLGDGLRDVFDPKVRR
ncbi:ABC transporter permease [Chelatococcus asaccharovorans]|nr:ABC transporter permease [Chelatococcus asaccharovorans]MBS7707696.1 ABC transporter permease [Chelatococcus asaccharovorans]